MRGSVQCKYEEGNEQLEEMNSCMDVYVCTNYYVEVRIRCEHSLLIPTANGFRGRRREKL